MKEYQVKITGTKSLLMHRDNIEWADCMEEWKNNPENKKLSKAGDDRTPAWRWLGCVYHKDGFVGLPQENIMRCLMEAGAMVPVPGGRSGKTFKSQTQSGMMSGNDFWPLTTADGAMIEWSDLKKLEQYEKFADHKKYVQGLGFDLMAKRAKVGSSKHIRVRPIFHMGWSVSGSIVVWDDQITDSVLKQIFEYAGRYKGLGDWRPGGKTPGPYGMFSVEIE